MVYNNLEISPASPKEIRYWAERCLPTGEVVGEVTSWETVNYKTLKPEPNGLFCQKIFGPIVDYTCACGKKALKLNMGFCSKCGVERTTSQVRRYRMGYINLKQPVAHTLYASQKPSPLGFCLNWPNKKLQAVLYGTEFCHLSDPFQFFYNPQIRDSQPEKYIKIAKYSFQPQSSSKLNLVQRKKLPRFILKKNKMPLNLPVCKKIYSRVQLSFSSHLYGINYDMSWRQVEDFQDFLLYMWEQPWSTDRLIPYYFLTQTTENYTSQTIPNHVQYYPIQTGGFVFQAIFSYYNLIGLQRQLTLDLHEIKRTVIFLKDKTEKRTLSKIQKSKLQIEISRFKEVEKKILRRFIYFRDFHKGNIQPAWMILSYLPILPPGLRPITSIRGELIVSDLNSLYRKVLTRNRRLINSTQFNIFDTALSGSWASWCYNLRQVQESVDSLLKTGKVESGKNIKSLLDALKGKRGRFRQHLLGKRVDYSGRSVIVVGPQLKIYECGLPKQMAVELFQPFLIQQLRNKGIAFTTTGAKAIIMERKPIIWTLLREILQSHPILLNRAPTLHRLGIQAFIPKLVDGKAILLHPLVCPAFNADFDGDQMAVHVPLSPSARSEAFNLLLACNHLLAPASGQPLLLPTQDMILGCYYLTISKEKTDYTVNNFFDPVFGKQTKNKGNWYLTIEEVLEEYQTNKLHLHTPVWIFWQGEVQNFNSEHYSQEKNTPIEFRLDIVGTLETIYSDKYQILGVNLTQSITGTKQTFIRTTPGRVIFYNLMNSALLK